MLPSEITPPEKGTMRQLADDLYWLRFDLPFRLNHINLYVLDGEDGWIILDCGVHDPATVAHWDALMDGPLAGRPIERIIVSHHHVDHAGYAGPLAERTGAPVWMTESEYRYIVRMLAIAGPEFGELLEGAYRRYALTEEVLAMARQDHDRFPRFVAPMAEPNFMTEDHSVRSRGGEWRVRIDRGHSMAQIGLLDDARGLYLAGDYLLPRISPNISADLSDPDDDRLGAYLDYLEEVSGLPGEMLILPGHDWPFTNGGERARVLIDHHHMRLDALTEAARNGPVTVASSMEVLFSRVFGSHEIFFAAGEARAHLTHLVATGRMVMTLDDGIERFSLAD